MKLGNRKIRKRGREKEKRKNSRSKSKTRKSTIKDKREKYNNDLREKNRRTTY